MQTLLIAGVVMVGYIVAYNLYGTWLSKTIFRLDANADVPSRQLQDDVDYVPTKKGIIFGHHFTSIAGTGPIVGPAIAVMWGWLPALLWVFFGSIFIGAVHDFGSLVVSMRNRGQTVGDVAGRLLNKRVRILFLLILFMALTIVLAIFGLVIAVVFKQYPASIIPCIIQIPIAIGIGIWLHQKGMNLLVPSILALGVMYLTVIFGNVGFLGTLNKQLAALPIIAWVAILLIYSYVASVLPVWLLLQPRDYINSLQLISALGLIVAGLVVAAFVGGAPVGESADRMPLEIVAPMIRASPEGAPLIIPFLFITIACGACSGFHCLVSSGTSSKQIACETDAKFVGYGSMLTEGFLATIVILACVAGLGLGATEKTNVGRVVTGNVIVGEAAYMARYETWGAAKGLGAKVGAFVDGSANFLKAMGIPAGTAVALMGVLVASFAGTTLDTACRLQRYVVQELAGTFVRSKGESGQPSMANPVAWLTNKHGATVFAIVIAAAIASLPAPGADWTVPNAGKGGLILWPLFGATNQLLAGFAFLVIFFFLWRRNLPTWFVAIPMIFMLIMPAWAMIAELPGWISPDDGQRNWPVILIGIVTLALEAWMIVEAFLLWPQAKGILEEELPPLPTT